MKSLFVIFLMTAAVAFGSSVSLPGGSSITGLRRASNDYQREHPSVVPNSIDDLRPFLNPDWLKKKQSEFTWFDSPIPFQAGEIIALTNYSILEDRRSSQGRYVLYVDSNGILHSGWFSEDDISFAFEVNDADVPNEGLFVQPVTDWKKLPDYLNRMPVERRESFLRNVESKYKLSVRNGELVRLDPMDQTSGKVTVEVAAYPESEINKPAEVAPVEVAEEAPEESTNWLLWLIGVLVVLGGLVLVVRRKS